ncbi:molybdopterin-synthase adenylyltransferase MoeB [Nesterenkonia sandarakina]|uniref:Adenylyltransferase/sulfurtransferase n=1 Tax=Nesterenkonia sandarakina TaxID=272918 RepID=A0A2T0YQM1_9MICC|nr:molybdopterin-synthase adenylyltransferase MoeB [Nesterenkonia sandarakina]PRZ17695.1 adenylyltransferase/sulfurtransferase [Nesterenkonia sandarakina]
MNDLSQFSRSQMERFQRHFSLDGFGIEAQAKLLNSRVVVVGAGGLGAPILTYLAAAGVGTIDVIDHDVVDRSNLHRQVIHSEASIGEPKTASAAAVMRGLHPEIVINEHREPITAANALELIDGADIVVDGSDNFTTRYVVADACEIADKPMVSGSILRFAGQVSLFWASRGPTYRDLYPEAPDAGEVPTCAQAGVLGVLPGVIGSIMATETIKFLTGIGETLLGRVLIYDALGASFREISLHPDPDRVPVTSIGADVAGLGGFTANAPAAAVSTTAVPPAASRAAEEDAADVTESITAVSVDGAAPAAEPTPEPAVVEDLDFNPFTGDPKLDDDVTPKELRELLDAGLIGGIVDVREPWEHRMGTIEGAVNVPLGDLWHGDTGVSGLDDAAGKPVVLYCKIGVRSRQALEVLRQRHPRAELRNLIGGYELYKQL